MVVIFGWGAGDATDVGEFGPAGSSLRDQLEDLASLHADGVLTDEEFAAAKRRLLGI